MWGWVQRPGPSGVLSQGLRNEFKSVCINFGLTEPAKVQSVVLILHWHKLSQWMHEGLVPNCHDPGSESVLPPAIWRSLFKPWITQYTIHSTYNDVYCETTKCHDFVWWIKGTLRTMLLHFRKQAWEHLYKKSLRHCHSLYLRLGIMKSEKINVNVSIQTMFDLPGGKIKSALSSLPFLRASLEEFWKCKPFLFLFGRCDFF